MKRRRDGDGSFNGGSGLNPLARGASALPPGPPILTARRRAVEGDAPANRQPVPALGHPEIYNAIELSCRRNGWGIAIDESNRLDFVPMVKAEESK